MTLPPAGYFSDLTRDQGEMRVALEDQRDFVEVTAVPPGGTIHQVLAKVSATDHDVAWTDPSTGTGWSGQWEWDTALVPPPTIPPVESQVRLNTAHPYTTATLLFIQKVTTDGKDTTNVLLNLSAGQAILIQDKDDASLYVLVRITAAPTDHGHYVEMEVAWEKNGGALLDNQAVLVATIARSVIGPPGPEGPQGEPGPAGPGVPAGGSTDQVLVKVSGADYDTAWVDAPAGGGGAMDTVWQGTDAPTDPDTELWLDTDETMVTPQAHVQVFTASGDFTVPAGVTLLQVTICGGGGGAGSGRCGSAGQGGGGGAGAHAIVRYPLPVTPGAVMPVVVGAAGVGGAAAGPGTTDGNDGTRGGDSTFAHLTAYGGDYGRKGQVSGGAAGGVITYPPGAALSGQAGSTSFAAMGSPGGTQSLAGSHSFAFAGGLSPMPAGASGPGGGGGASIMGPGGTGGYYTATGTIARPGSTPDGYGGGGGGGSIFVPTTGGQSGAGGNGGPGVVILEWVG